MLTGKQHKIEEVVADPLREFRVPRSYRALFMVGLLFVAAMGVGSVTTAYWNTDGSFPHPKRDALLLGIGWGLFCVLELWCAVLSFRDRLVLGPASLSYRGVIQKRIVPYETITKLTWPGRGAQSGIVIRTSAKRMTLSLYFYTKEDRRAIIDFIRNAVSDDLQEGWTEFVAAEVRAAQPPPESAVTAAICLLIFAATGAVFIVSWYHGVGTQWLLAGTGCAIVVLWYTWRIRRFVRSRWGQTGKSTMPSTGLG